MSIKDKPTEDTDGLTSHLSRRREELLLCLDSYLEAIEVKIASGSRIDLPAALKNRIEAVARQKGCSTNKVAAVILSKYLDEGKRLLSSDEKEEEEDGAFDI